jgi:ATP-dependent Clp protease ATP-binding subunit ClpX
MTLFPHQKSACSHLLATARVFFESDWSSLPVHPRFTRLVVGPTGVGKSHLVRVVADEMDVPCLELTATNWIPLGANQRGARPTWIDIIDFCRLNIRGLIFVDEIDKLFGFSSWINYIRVEVFGVLDRRAPDNLTFPTDEQTDPDELKGSLELGKVRLRSGMFLVGAGAFQNLWQQKRSQPIGFGDSGTTPPSDLSHTDMATVLPAEIVNRFASPVLTLRQLNRADYEAILKEVLCKLPSTLVDETRKVADATIEAAVDSHTGCRWIEEVMLQVLINRTESVNPSPELPHPFVEP